MPSTLFAKALCGMGVAHFAAAPAVESIIPPQLPGSRRFYNFASGLWEIAAGVLLHRRATRGAGGWLAFALLLAVWPANFYHAWLQRRQGGLKRVYHVLRLPAQLLLLKRAWKLARG